MTRRITLAVLLAASLIFPAHALAKSNAKAPAPFDLEHLLTINSISDPVWSPDGGHVAFVVTSVDTAEDSNNQDIWLFDATSRQSIRLTRHPKNDFSPTFSPSGDTIAFVANRGTGEDARPAIWMMSLHGGEPWSFGSFDESIGEVAWSPDGRSLAYVKLDTLPKSVREQRKKKRDAVTEDERLQYPHLWVMDLASGKSRRLTSGELYVWYVRWSPDSKHLAFITSPTGKPDDGNLQDIGVVSADGGPVRKLGALGAPFTWSPNSRWIAWASGGDRTLEVQKTDLWLEPATGGAPTNLTASFDGNADTPSWSGGSDTLYFHVDHGVTSRIAAVLRAGGDVQLGVDRHGDAGTPIATVYGRAAWVQSSPTEPVELWIADRVNEPGRRATSINTAVSRLTLGTTRTVQWTSTDGVRVEGVLVRPAGVNERAALKTIVQLHGGPYGSRYGLGFQAAAQWFAAHGYQVFMPNFRSSSGYGTAFMVRKRSDWGGQDWRDVTTGVDSLVKWGLADPARLGMFGHSYGAYLTAWGITQTNRFDAAIVSAGAVDLAAHYGQSDIHKYRAFDFGGTPWEAPENWTRASPMTHITKVKTPTLILVGEADPRVPYPQSQELYQALKTLHVPVEFTHYPREGHTVREPRHRADELQRSLAWWNRWLQ